VGAHCARQRARCQCRLRGRGACLPRALVQGNASRLAETERRDNGKLASEVIARVKHMGDYFKYYAGRADKVQSHLIPTDKKGVFTYTRYELKARP
jgi:(Z)-2-((N-methylformamido)methylene)-5-hydroxybutyrolactone dehydrogenase